MRGMAMNLTDLDPRVLASISLNKPPPSGLGMYGCGCQLRADVDRAWLCSYHEGYDDALSVHAPPVSDDQHDDQDDEDDQ